jgi:hypothetical protein
MFLSKTLLKKQTSTGESHREKLGINPLCSPAAPVVHSFNLRCRNKLSLLLLLEHLGCTQGEEEPADDEGGAADGDDGAEDFGAPESEDIEQAAENECAE